MHRGWWPDGTTGASEKIAPGRGLFVEAICTLYHSNPRWTCEELQRTTEPLSTAVILGVQGVQGVDRSNTTKVAISSS